MSFLRPDMMFERLTDITPRLLRERGIRALLLDVDNTLAPPDCPVPFEDAVEWVASLQEAGIEPAVLSNAGEERVRDFAEKIGLPFVHKAMKPLGFGYRRALRLLGLPPSAAAMVGDQLFTDVLGAKFAGLSAFWIRPKVPETGFSFRLRRRLERKVLKQPVFKDTLRPEKGDSR